MKLIKQLHGDNWWGFLNGEKQLNKAPPKSNYIKDSKWLFVHAYSFNYVINESYDLAVLGECSFNDYFTSN